MASSCHEEPPSCIRTAAIPSTWSFSEHSKHLVRNNYHFHLSALRTFTCGGLSWCVLLWKEVGSICFVATSGRITSSYFSLIVCSHVSSRISVWHNICLVFFHSSATCWGFCDDFIVSRLNFSGENPIVLVQDERLVLFKKKKISEIR